MEIVPTGSARRLSSVLTTLSRAGLLLGVSLSLVACGPLEDMPEHEALATHAQELESINGLSLNGLSLNGLSLNGLSLNGLSLNGLSLNGLSSSQFGAWFQTNTPLNDLVMKYIVRCAVPAGETRSYKSTTGPTWTWAGGLGLAPDWSGGKEASLTEQRIVSACLAAHANKFGVQISMSIQGLNAKGVAIPTSPRELRLYPEREGCFFGNLFNNEGIYAGNDHYPLNHRKSTARACALSIKQSGPPECAPMIRVDPDCEDICTPDASGNFYTSCTYNGITYPAITTRLLTEDIYTCGDGTCQLSESCGTGNDYDDCKRDCGLCP
ncbi:hypothetical protein [Melittangium boletus]|uniref:Uncharacterized protein n=1 Tax=Melittangium boletus DSM 14713 TaxID=1294270 RepID=A0A250INI2_9BACT|nr:hypothetical protein [Melittangium boletus]ATB32810.1 hypothetical protein MEBOL_006299 [Melittangium boletus DSM 14713]